ncbi:GNAT family N-acetyltransferase [Nitratireductor indicus]|uniref:GNAT family N-acetyltransferase n=1 Tax=Nitratireductor indicus TaxID=721133 RepID=UPI002875B098|nr:GNAT family N-acetyltransferase [Nitratireductor indicus]MDS1134827.1 GNAT family N-acetyltransferase [Nitratireductor indicus]
MNTETGKQTQRPAVSPRGLGATIARADDAGLMRYRADSAEALYMPAQSPEWAQAWALGASMAGESADIVIIRVADGQRHITSFLCEVIRQGPFKVARFLGGSHANGNFPLRARTEFAVSSQEIVSAMTEAARRERPDIDLLMLERQIEKIEGLDNPLLAYPHRPSPNVSLAVDLDGGFDALLARSSGKRKRKQNRAQVRRFESAGGFRRMAATSRAESDALLDAFFAMKKVRFAKMGIHDVFAPAEVKNAFRELFGAATAEADPRFVMHGLEVGGKLRAVTGSSRIRDRLICEFSSISEDELTDASPGAYLFYENIQEACQEGLSVYDFSVGDEYYKRLWCDIETVQFDTLIPLTTKGRMLAAGRVALAAAKRTVTSNPRLLAAVKSLRRRIASLGGQ